jgi:hypothetical protein
VEIIEGEIWANSMNGLLEADHFTDAGRRVKRLSFAFFEHVLCMNRAASHVLPNL